MKKQFISLLNGFLLCLGLTFLCPSCNTSSMNLYDMELTDLAGNAVDLTQYKGKAVVLNFWATWCAPCRKEKKHLDNARAILAAEGFEFISVSEEAIEVIKTYKEKQPYQLTYYHHPSNIKLKGVFEIPQTYVFDKSGKMVFSQTGMYAWDAEKSIDMLRALCQ